MKTNFINKFGFVFMLLLLSLPAFGQVLKLKATSFATKIKISSNKWSEWSETTESSVLITVNLNNDRITIYSNTTQVYDIAKHEGKITDNDGDEIVSFYCVNKDGLTCRVRIVKLNSQNKRNQVYVDFRDIKWYYNVYSLE
jgi:lipopolysaccharide export system protein LptA